ncbi:MAG TPA: hypothetical protein DDZ51_06065 [Planctomycetaceae bacterium]|nr:hypothetical protein [Planctomycetaceae bacterium]
MSKHSFLLVSIGVFLGLFTGSLVQLYVPEFPVASAQTVAAPKPAQLIWLNQPDDDKFSQIERQMRGFDTTMMEVGYRYDELVEAVKNRNYEYAKYQTEKIGHTISLGIERRPKRAKSARPFLDVEIPKMLSAIAKQQAEILDSAIHSLHEGCIRCHRSENVLFMGSRFATIQPIPDDMHEEIKRFQDLLNDEFIAKADRANGHKLFTQSCKNCHSIFGEGSHTGPNLQTLPMSDRNYLIKSIIAPNATVGFDYMTQQFLTHDGKVLTGLILSEDEVSLTLQTANETLAIQKSDIEERKASSVSVMPEGILQKLTHEEARDLFAYLQGSEQTQ